MRQQRVLDQLALDLSSAETGLTQLNGLFRNDPLRSLDPKRWRCRY